MGRRSLMRKAVAAACLTLSAAAGTAAPAQQAYIKPSQSLAGNSFGISVAVSEDTMVVGSGAAVDVGVAYVFVRRGTNWNQQAYLSAVLRAETRDAFGASVAVSGDTAVVGAPFDSSSANGVNGNETDYSVTGSGAAYVFVRNGSNWTQQAYLKASNTRANADFGYRVGISGDTVVVAATGESSNATGVNGDDTNTNAPNSGAVYVFRRSGTNWSQQAYLKPSNEKRGTTSDAAFGESIALYGDTLAVGAPAFGLLPNLAAAYVF